MAALRNIFACLVHESPECVIDLVRSLRFLDASSVILLYNGGRLPHLLDSIQLERYGAVAHPSPKPMAWGHLHEFALDCMQFALKELPFDTLTIVDSDQLGTRPGYSDYLAHFIGTRREIGLLSSSPGVLPQATQAGPAQTALREIEIWRPFLRRFAHGEQKFVHWSFWPSTVFLADAARDLTRLFATDTELHDLMARTRIWATEEVILPTLVALLGYEIAANPCSYDYVKYRASFNCSQVDAALARDDVFWMHPIPRNYDDGLRRHIRERLHRYEISSNGGHAVRDTKSTSGFVLAVPILNRMRRIQGWLDDEEADLLIAACSRALASHSDRAVVEVGSFCGRSTVVLGSVVQAMGGQTMVYAIDPHNGVVGAADSGTQSWGSTLDAFRRNISENGLISVVEVIASRSYEVAWEKPIGFLLIDALHDYVNVARDFRHFEPWVVEGGYIAFHDYADYYPGVKVLVDEILAFPEYERLHCSGSMIVVRKKVAGTVITARNSVDASVAAKSASAAPARAGCAPASAPLPSLPLVSCIMPTANRPQFVPEAIRHFLRQDYPNRELVILDDGVESVAGLVPADDRVRYVRLAQRITMGAKHNMACEMAHGEVIVHWDDDDWNAERRVSYQVGELLRHPPDTLCGLARVLYYDPLGHRAWEYTYPGGGRPWVLGATFCYYKRFWERNRFPDMNEGADTVYVWNLQNAHVVAHQDHTFYIGTVHAGNTSPKRTETSGWRPFASQQIRGLLDDRDWSFYERLGGA